MEDAVVLVYFKSSATVLCDEHFFRLITSLRVYHKSDVKLPISASAFSLLSLYNIPFSSLKVIIFCNTHCYNEIITRICCNVNSYNKKFSKKFLFTLRRCFYIKKKPPNLTGSSLILINSEKL